MLAEKRPDQCPERAYCGHCGYRTTARLPLPGPGYRGAVRRRYRSLVPCIRAVGLY